MKKIILFTITFLLISLIQLNAQESTNYSRKDLIHIEGFTSTANPEGVYDLTWEIGQELINAQDNFSKKKDLKDYIKRNELQKIADSYINEILKPEIAITKIRSRQRDECFCLEALNSLLLGIFPKSNNNKFDNK